MPKGIKSKPRKPRADAPMVHRADADRTKPVEKIVLAELMGNSFDEERFELFLANYSQNISTEKACEAAGTTRWALNRWLRKNPDRVDEMKRAIEVPILTQIKDWIAQDWRAGAWILERCFPERYALQNIVRHTGGVNVTLVDKVPEEEAIRFANDIRDMEASIVAMPKLLNGSHS